MTPRDVKPAPKSFVLPFELVGSRPRDVQLTATGRVLHGLAVALMAGAIVVAILLSWVSAEQADERDDFNRDAVTTTAQVTRVWRESGESKPRMVAYRYQDHGTVFEGRSKISSAHWRALRVGSPIDIRYLPADPAASVVVGREPGDVLPPFVPFLVGGLMVGAGLLMLMSLNGQRRLLEEGRAAPAVITDVVKHTSQHGTHRSIKYTFPLLSGATATGKSDASSKPPAVGSVICIVYDPDRPDRNRRYPFPLVKTARL